jgi:uncharacterized protein YdhG (YjbR/CyaY superfamily)
LLPEVTAMPETRKATKRTVKAADALTAEEKAAMKEHVAEVRASARRGGTAAEKAAADEKAQVDKIAELGDGDRALAERVHALIKAAAPQLAPKLWYGMPAYYQDGKPLVFFQPADKFKARYATLGFNDGARLDDGAMWPTAYALTTLTAAAEKQITALIRKAAG